MQPTSALAHISHPPSPSGDGLLRISASQNPFASQRITRYACVAKETRSLIFAKTHPPVTTPSRCLLSPIRYLSHGGVTSSTPPVKALSTRLNASLKTGSIAASLKSRHPLRGTTTTSHPTDKTPRFLLNDSRNNRFIRFLRTAPPNRRPTSSPSLE